MPIVPLPTGRSGLRWGIYDRISGKQGTRTGDDDDETVSLDTQDERNRALIKELDPTGTIVESCVVREVWTGVELFTRPKLMQVLLPAIRAGEIDAIACFHPWRWAREPNHAGYLYTELDHHGVKLRFAEDDPGDDEKGRLLGFIQHWSGQADHKTRTEQTHRGRAKLVHLGHAWAGSKAAYGFRWRYQTIEHPDGRIEQKRIGLQIEPAEAAIVRRIYHELLGGASLRGIALRLTEDGVPSPTGLTSWTDGTVRYLVKQTVYAGEAYGLRNLRDKSKPRIGVRGKSAGRPKYRDVIRPEDEWVKLPDGHAPEIVDRATYDAAREMLGRRHRGGSAPAPTALQTLMGGGRARCAECRNTLSRLGSTRLALICSGRAMKKCTTRPSIRMAQLDEAAKRLARWIYEHPEAIREQAEAHRRSDPVEAELAIVERTLADIDKKQRGVALVAGAVSDPDAAAPLVAQLEALAGQKKQAERDRADLERQRASWEETVRVLDRLTDHAARVSRRLDAFTHAEWQEAIDALGMKAEVYPARAPERFRLSTSIGGVAGWRLLAGLAAESGEPYQEWRERDGVWVMRSGGATTTNEPHLTLIWSASQIAALPQPPAPRLAPAAVPRSAARDAVARAG